MKSKVITLSIGIIIGVVTMYGFDNFASSSESDFEQLPVEFYNVLYEDKNIRIIEHVLEPGEVEPMHNHPPMYAYVIEGSQILRIGPDGSKIERQPTNGQRIELTNPITHSLENVGESTLKTLIVEFNEY